MLEVRTLAVQSVLYGNSGEEIVRAARALTNSLAHARAAGLIGDWTYRLGDCSDVPVLTTDVLAQLEQLVQSAGGAFNYRAFGKNLGSAAGHNALADGNDHDLILILNPDAQVAPDALSVLAQTVQGDVGIAEARQVPLEHPKDFEVGTGVTSWASTACALTTRGVFEQVGGFDADTFFLYCDDVDYSWRVRLAGYSVRFAPEAAVFHDKRLTVGGDWQASSAEVYYSAEAALLLAHKYSRPRIVAHLLHAFDSDGHEATARAAAEYRRRKRENLLPAPIDSEHHVGSFIGGNYAQHRF